MRCFVHTVQKWIESSAYDHHFHNIPSAVKRTGFSVCFFFSGGELHTEFEPRFFLFLFEVAFFPFILSVLQEEYTLKPLHFIADLN